MTSDVQDAWNACLFALRPVSVSEDGREITIEFCWLKHGDVWMQRLERPCLASSLCQLDPLLRLHDNYTGELISSGRQTTISTTFSKYYVPSFQLLTLQWHLTRIAAMVSRWDLLEDSEEIQW